MLRRPAASPRPGDEALPDLAAITIQDKSGTYRHLQGRVSGLLGESSQNLLVCWVERRSADDSEYRLVTAKRKGFTRLD